MALGRLPGLVEIPGAASTTTQPGAKAARARWTGAARVPRLRHRVSAPGRPELDEDDDLTEPRALEAVRRRSTAS